jgi:hypothetical protein
MRKQNARLDSNDTLDVAIDEPVGTHLQVDL